MGLAALPHSALRAEGPVSAEEQKLRDLFLRVRDENRREKETPRQPPAPAPLKGAAPKAVPAPAKPRAAAPRAPAAPRNSLSSASAPAGSAPPPPSPRAGSTGSRVGEGSPPKPSVKSPPKPVASSPGKATATAAATPAPPSVKAAGEVADESLGGKLRDLADDLSDRLSSLPRTAQSHAREAAAAAGTPDGPATPVMRSATVPPVLGRKPVETRPAPVLKVAPEVPERRVPGLPAAPAIEAPAIRALAKIGDAIPKIDTDSLLDGGRIDLNAEEPEERAGLADTAESIRRSLLEDADVPDPSTKSPALPVAPVSTSATPAPGPSSFPSTVPNGRPRSGAPSFEGMAGAAFERLARHAMALGMTAVMDPAPLPIPTPPEPTPPPGVAPAEPVREKPAPEDDVPDYVKAALKPAGPTGNTGPLREDHRPPSLNDFVISASHQTNFDIESSSITFAGHVVVESSRFHLTCDRFVVHMLPDQKGMDYGEALGNVVIEMMNQRQPTGHTGHARAAIYRPEDGEIVLSGWPRIVEENKELVGITEDAKMVLTTSGTIRTIGRNRTILKR